MRTALRAQDANALPKPCEKKEGYMGSRGLEPRGPANRGGDPPNADLRPADLRNADLRNADSRMLDAARAGGQEEAGATAVYIDDERDSLRSWRARWRQIMQSAVIYFDDIPAPQVERLKGYLVLLGSSTQPFYDQKVTHVISENSGSELASKARARGCKVYTVNKLSRFVGSLLGRTIGEDLDQVAGSSKLAKLLENDQRGHANRREDFVAFKGPYLLVSDASGFYRPLIMKEWHTPHETDDSEWPQLRRAPMGVSPFTAKAALRADKRRYAPVVEPESKRRHVDKENLLPKEAARTPTQASQPLQNSQASQAAPHARVNGLVPAQSTNSVRLREFGEIVASGVPRYSQASQKSFARDGVNSREMASLCRKVTGSHVAMARNPAQPDQKHRAPPPRSKPAHKKPGYCENCLARYSDLQEHLASKTHQQFAANESKFEGLDRVIALLQRPTDRTDRPRSGVGVDF